MDRRQFLQTSALGVGTLAFGGSLWAGAFTSEQEFGHSRYGSLRPPDRYGVALPEGFRSRVVARTGRPVGPTGYRWHAAPDGGACFPDGRGWVYVSNSEVYDTGGASAIRFAADGSIAAAYRILDGTDRNCAGGPTPWQSWLSCEEVRHGLVYETDPFGRAAPVVRPAMGRFTHEAAAVDPERRVVYLTEDEADGCFYRFRPFAWPSLAHGALEVLRQRGDGSLTWAPLPDPDARQEETRYQVPGANVFDGGEGAWYDGGGCWFTTKGDGRVWRYDADRHRLGVAYDGGGFGGPLVGVDNVTASPSGEVFVAEDGPDMRVCVIHPGGSIAPFLWLAGHGDSEVTGPAFSPDGSRLYFSSQRGTGGSDDDGITYEVRGPFRRTWGNTRLDGRRPASRR